MASPFNNLEEKILRRLPYEILSLAILIAMAILIFFDSLSALLCLAGGLISCLSFLWLKKIIFFYLKPEKRKRLRRLILFQLLRFGLIGLIFLIIIYFFSSRGLAFLVGFSALLLAIAGEMIFSFRKR